MFWNRVVNWDGSDSRYQASDGGRWYTISRNGVGVWVLRVSVAGGTPGEVEFRHNCSTLNRAKETANKINNAEREAGNGIMEADRMGDRVAAQPARVNG